MKNIGFLLLHIDNDPHIQNIMRGIEDVITKDHCNHYVVFGSSVDVPISNSIPVLHMDYAKYFDGDLWFFNIEGLQFYSAFNVFNAYFYTNNTPWISNYTDYRRWESLLSNPDLNIVVNSQELSDIYALCWQNTTGIMETFNYEQIQKFVQ